MDALELLKTRKSISAPFLAEPAPTLARSHGKLTRGVFPQGGRSVGLLDDARLFQSLQERLR